MVIIHIVLAEREWQVRIVLELRSIKTLPGPVLSSIVKARCIVADKVKTSEGKTTGVERRRRERVSLCRHWLLQSQKRIKSRAICREILIHHTLRKRIVRWCADGRVVGILRNITKTILLLLRRVPVSWCARQIVREIYGAGVAHRGERGSEDRRILGECDLAVTAAISPFP